MGVAFLICTMLFLFLVFKKNIFAFVFIKHYYEYDAKNVNILRNEVMFVHRHNNFPR